MKNTVWMVVGFLLFVGGIFYTEAVPLKTLPPKKPPPAIVNKIKPPLKPLPKIPPFKADLAVVKIRFLKQGSTGTLFIHIQNLGEASSSQTKVKASLFRPDGSTLKRSWNIRSLRKGEVLRIKWNIVPGEGKNVVQVKIDDPVNQKNNHKELAFFFKQEKASRSVFSATSLKAFAKKNLKKGLPLPQKHTGITTYARHSQTTFIRPISGRKFPVGAKLRIEWSIGEKELSPRPRLTLWLISEENPPLIPELVIFRDLSVEDICIYGVNTCLYHFDTSLLPPGRYALKLGIFQPGRIKYFYRSFALDRPRIKVLRIDFVNSELDISAGEQITAIATVVNQGAKALKYTPLKMKAFFKEVETGSSILLAHKEFDLRNFPHGQEKNLSLTFRVPAPGGYSVTLEPVEINGKKGIFWRRFLVTAPRDLLVSVGEIPNKRVSEKVPFPIRVRSYGWDGPIPVELRIGSETHRFSVRINRMGEGEYTFKKSFSTAGRRTYEVIVDPDNEFRENDENNNRVTGTFQVFNWGEPIPQSSPREAGKIVVTEVLGLPPNETFVPPKLKDWSWNAPFLLHLKCVSSVGGSCPAFELVPAVKTRWTASVLGTFPERSRVRELFPGESLWWRIPLSVIRNIRWETEPSPFAPGSEVFFYLKMRDPNTGNFLGTLLTRAYKVAKGSDLNSISLKKNIGLNTRGISKMKPHHITVLSPARNKIWSPQRTYQIAWTGKAQGPYSLTLIAPDQHRVTFAEGISGHTYNFILRREAPYDGPFWILVEGRDGEGLSAPFYIRSGLPHPKVVAASFLTDIMECGSNPYQVRVKVRLENMGGYQEKPFEVKIKAYNGQQLVASSSVRVSPMLDNRFTMIEGVLPLKRAGTYRIAILPAGEKVPFESNYRVKPLPDLKVEPIWEGRHLRVRVINIGEKTSLPSFVRAYIEKKGETPWISSSLPVKSLGGNESTSVDVPDPPFSLQGGERFTVRVEHSAPELCTRNNVVTGSVP